MPDCMNISGLSMFDYDGVIVDSLELFISDFTAACRENLFFGLNSREDIMALFEGNVYEKMKERGLDQETIDRILTAYGVRAAEHVDDARIFDGMAEALIKISEKNDIYIITSNISGIPARVLSRNGIRCIKDIVGADREKSKIKKIQSLMMKYPDLPAYYVGDTGGDMIEGKKAGAVTIGVAWGWHGASGLMKSSPDFLAFSPGELVLLLCGNRY